jgi:hypothetical protein
MSGRGQTAQSCLSSAPVVGPFDPGHDRDPQLLAVGMNDAAGDVAADGDGVVQGVDGIFCGGELRHERVELNAARAASIAKR